MTDSIVLFVAIPLFLSFFPLLEKINHNIKVGKAASVVYFAVSFIMLFIYAPGIFSGKEYNSIVGGWTDIVGISQTLDGFFLVRFSSYVYSFLFFNDVFIF